MALGISASGLKSCQLILLTSAMYVPLYPTMPLRRHDINSTTYPLFGYSEIFFKTPSRLPFEDGGNLQIKQKKNKIKA